ncbi:protein kinase C delta type-like [Eleutherodactylus coqui]|uniref:protein kinase C delta type-like n=1 Tax=Eleutherodactylus coqui TaxID=57060 RepID=UPI0034624425
MVSIGHRGDGEKRKREEESESGLTERKKRRSGENAIIIKDGEPTPGTSQDPGPSDSGCYISRFTSLQILGRGSFSKVVLASFPGRNTFMAIKVVDRRRSNPIALMRERRILLKAQDCPFICHLYAAQQSADQAYFVMEYLSGGSLATLIRMCGRLDISSVRFYTAEIVCGLQFLHRRAIVHRDIKPENIMLDSAGHIRLIDLGLARDGVTASNKITGRTGTLQYMAPEVLLGKAYDAAVDWWSLGIVVSWMAAGQSPFYYGKDPKFPSWLDADLKDLLERLLCNNPEKRLGVHEDIRDHPFFNTMNWKNLELKREQPPFKPFSRVLENENLQWPEDGTPLHPVTGFSFTSPDWTRQNIRSYNNPASCHHDDEKNPIVKEATTIWLSPRQLSPEPTTLLL